MATTFTGVLSARINISETGTLGTSQTGQGNYSYNKIIATGTAANQFDCVYFVQSTIAGSGNTSTDLSGSLTDLFGTSVVFARLNYMFFHLMSTADGGSAASSISIGNATNALDGWISTATYTVKVYNDGIMLVGDPGIVGYPVVNASTDAVKVLNNDAGVSAVVRQVYIGKSA